MKDKLTTLLLLTNLAAVNGWSLTTTPSVFATKLLTAEEIRNIKPYYTGTGSGLYIKSYYGNSGDSYKSNLLVALSDLSYKSDTPKTIKSIVYSPSTMDAMGGVHIKATITYSDNTTDVDEDQSKFTISEGSNQNISGVYTIQGIDKLVLSNSDNKDTTTKTRNLSITYGGVTNTVSVTLSAEKYGRYIVKDSSNPDLSTATWDDVTWLNDYGDGMKNAKRDWYITEALDTAFSLGTEIPTDDPVRGAKANYTSSSYTFLGSDGRSKSPRNYHMAWVDKRFDSSTYQYWIFDYDNAYIDISNCESAYIESNGGSKTISFDYSVYYKKPIHRYGLMSIIYAEAYPDKFRNDSVGLGFPWHITYKVINNSDTDYDWDVIKNNSRTDVHGDSLASEIVTITLTMPTTPNGDVSTNPTVNGATCHYPTLLMPQGDNTQDYTYTVHYSFLCPEICTKDTSGNIIRDISDASSITNSEPAVNKSYKYNTTCTNTYTKVKDDNVLLYAIDSHHPSKFCLNGWAHNLDSYYLFYPTLQSSTITEELNIQYAINNKLYCKSLTTLPTGVTKDSNGIYSATVNGELVILSYIFYGPLYSPYLTVTGSYYCNKATTIKAVDSDSKNRYIEASITSDSGTLTIKAGLGPISVTAGTVSFTIHSGYSTKGVDVTISQATSSATLTDTISGNSDGQNDLKLTWSDLDTMGDSTYKYDSTRIDNFN